MDLHDSIALITGAGAGIGRAIARSLARADVRLVLTDVDPRSLAAVAEELTAHTEVLAYELDVRDRDRFAEVVDRAEADIGPITVLCNNAGLAFPESTGDISYDSWDLMLGINLGGVVNGIQTVLPRMIERARPAHIVNTASAAGLMPAAGFAYTAAKYAVVGLSESLRQRLRAEGHPVSVSVLCPGAVATDLARTSHRTLAGHRGDAVFARSRERIDERIDTMDEVLHRHGADPDAVGELAVAAVTTDQFYVLTDRSGADMVANRFRDILDAMPDGDPAGGSAAEFLERVRGTIATAPPASGAHQDEPDSR